MISLPPFLPLCTSRFYRNVPLGSDLIQWFLKNLLGWERLQCVHFAQYLVREGYLLPMSESEGFKERRMYQFTVPCASFC